MDRHEQHSGTQGPDVMASGVTEPKPPDGMASGVPGPKPPDGMASGVPGPEPPDGMASGVLGPDPPDGMASGVPGPDPPDGMASGVPGPDPPDGMASGGSAGNQQRPWPGNTFADKRGPCDTHTSCVRTLCNTVGRESTSRALQASRRKAVLRNCRARQRLGKSCWLGRATMCSSCLPTLLGAAGAWWPGGRPTAHDRERIPSHLRQLSPGRKTPTFHAGSRIFPHRLSGRHHDRPREHRVQVVDNSPYTPSIR